MGLWGMLGFVAFTLACLAVGLTATAVRWKMVEEVTARLDEKDRFELLGGHYLKSRRLLDAYRRLCPEGHLVRQEVLLGSVFLVLLVAAAWQVGFGPGPLFFLALVGSGSLCLMYRK